jgi:hypothetical protein
MDFIVQPRVARHELPWDNRPRESGNPEQGLNQDQITITIRNPERSQFLAKILLHTVFIRPRAKSR